VSAGRPALKDSFVSPPAGARRDDRARAVKRIAAALTAISFLVWAVLTLRALSGPEPEDARLARTVAFVAAIAFSLAVTGWRRR
jgi:hypothetical protein